MAGPGRAGQGRAGQGTTGQGRAGQGRPCSGAAAWLPGLGRQQDDTTLAVTIRRQPPPGRASLGGDPLYRPVETVLEGIWSVGTQLFSCSLQ
jgi:hypothetical protein